jgi:DNA processing protein
MSVATIVMQTDVVGGSMHTVRYTLMQGRRLVAPVPPGAHADEPKSRGIVALTQTTGAELARAVEATGAYAQLLMRDFADHAVATALKSRDDYTAFVKMLEMLADSRPARAVAAEDPTHGRPANPDTLSVSQLGLSIN